MADMQYVTVKRMRLVDGEKVERFMPALVNLGMIKPKALAQRIAKQGTLSEIEAKVFMKAVVKIIVDDLMDGFSVQLEGLGTLSPAITAKSVSKRDSCDADTIRRKYVRFTPSTDIKTELKTATFKKANLDVKHA